MIQISVSGTFLRVCVFALCSFLGIKKELHCCNSLVLSVALVVHDVNLNITLAIIFAHIENSANGNNSEQDIKGIFSDVDTNSPKLGNTVAQHNEKLVKILNAIADLNLGNPIDQTVNDTFSDAYEFLMTMYASNAGKSGASSSRPRR